MYTSRCMNCNTTFEHTRTDTQFCSPRCKAEYWREAGGTGEHENLDRFHRKECERCGTGFWYNAYAKRSGKRTPKYCSNKCRQSAFRESHNEKKRQEERAKDNAWREQARQNKQQREQGERQQTPPDFNTGDFRDNLSIPRRWTAYDAYVWLGVHQNSPRDVCASAFRSLNKRYHPDQNGGKEYPHLKVINAAYDFLKRNVFA